MSVTLSYKSVQHPTSLRWKPVFSIRVNTPDGKQTLNRVEPPVSAGTLAGVKDLLGTEAVRSAIWTAILKGLSAAGGSTEAVAKNRPSIYEGKPKLTAPPERNAKIDRIRSLYDPTRTALGSPVVMPATTFTGKDGQTAATGGVAVEVKRQTGATVAEAMKAAPVVASTEVIVAQPMRASQLAKEIPGGLPELMKRAEARGINFKHPNSGLTADQVNKLRQPIG